MIGTSPTDSSEVSKADVYFEFNFLDGIMVDCKEVNNGKWGPWHTHTNQGPMVPDDANPDLNYSIIGRESQDSGVIHYEEMEHRGNWKREKQRSLQRGGEGHQNIAGVQVLNLDNYTCSAHTSTTDACSMEHSKNKRMVQFANGENSHIVSASELHSLDLLARNSFCPTSTCNLRGCYDGHGLSELSGQLPFDMCKGDACNAREECNGGEASQGPVVMHQCMANKSMHTASIESQHDFRAQRDPTSLATGHLDWLWCEEPEGQETLQNEHIQSYTSCSLSKLAGRRNDHVEELGMKCMDDDLGPHDSRIRVIGRQSRKTPGSESRQTVSGTRASVDKMDSARCSSMSLTDLVETSPKKCLKDLVQRERSTLASHLQLAGSSLGTQFCTRERQTGTVWPFSPGHPFLNTSSPSRRDVAGLSTCLSICEPNRSGNTHGVLHCTLRSGLPNYTFLLDDYEEVVIAKIWMEDVVVAEDQGAWRYTFYSLKGDSKKKGRHGWKHWKKKEKLVSELVGKMRVSSVVHSEPSLDGGPNVSVESEFVLYSARAHNPLVHGKAGFSSQTSSSSLETLSHDCSKASHPQVMMSSSPSQSRASSSDGGISDVSSSGAISAWYVSQSLIPTSLGSPDMVRPKSRKWSLNSRILTMRTTKANKRSQQSTSVVASSLHTNTEEPSSEMLYIQSQPHSEMAAMIINVPLELQDPQAGSMPTAGFQSNELGHRTSDGTMEPQIHRVVDYNHHMKHKKYEQHRHANITVILPTGSHGRLLCDSKGPSPLIKRWKEGGKCDCKGWDLGCGLLVLNNEQPRLQDIDIKPSIGRDQQGRSKPLKLFRQDTEFDEPYLSLAPQENGLIAIDFRAPLSPLQALAMVVAILHGRSGAPDVDTSHNIPPLANVQLHAQGKGFDGDFSMVNGSDSRSMMSKISEGKVANGKTSPVNGHLGEPYVKAQVNDVFSCASELALSFERV